ncbi:MAG: MgtC/SapB family protein [Gammaproteobacteria bacterium]|nr:MgtC/SapB family protein [Gammaproteobacteria bacterium]
MSQFLNELYTLFQVLFSFIAGGTIGWEREHRGAQAGIRTFGCIAMGACVFGIISKSLPFPADPSRIASQVAIGVGFIGAGVIFRVGDQVGGLTTAATLWCTSAIGLAIAFGMYAVSITTTLIILVFLRIPRTRFWRTISAKANKAK